MSRDVRRSVSQSMATPWHAEQLDSDVGRPRC